MQKKDFIKIRVRYAETDQMGVVYYGNYAQYFEVGRTEWLRKSGITYKWMEDHGILLPVIDLHIQFKSSARYDDLLTIETELLYLPTVKIGFIYSIYNDSNVLITTGSTTLVFMDKKTKKIIKAPSYLLEKLKHIDFNNP